jgi:hypothetical protein
VENEGRKSLEGGLGNVRYGGEICYSSNQGSGGTCQSWFSSNLRRKVGNGDNTLFWEDSWAGAIPLREIFNSLYGISDTKSATANVVWPVVGGRSELQCHYQYIKKFGITLSF